jgi:hypothetical protein
VSKGTAAVISAAVKAVVRNSFMQTLLQTSPVTPFDLQYYAPRTMFL